MVQVALRIKPLAYASFIDYSVCISLCYAVLYLSRTACTNEKIHVYCAAWVIAAAKKEIYIEPGDSSRKISTICSSGNHFECELLRKQGGSSNSTGIFPASEMLIKKTCNLPYIHKYVNVHQNAMSPGNRTFTEADLFSFVQIFMLFRLLQPFVCFKKKKLNLKRAVTTALVQQASSPQL